MKIILINFIISCLTLIGYSQTCSDSKELENNCGKYCFTVVKPVLEHTVLLQKQVNNQDIDQKRDTLIKFENIERQLTILQDEVAKLKQNSVYDELEDHQQLFEKIGLKYYYIEKHQKTNWFTAVHKCHEIGGHLASLKNQREFDELIPKLHDQRYWIDINDLSHEGMYLSLTTGRTPYFNWHQGEPNNVGGEHCVLLERRNNGILMNDHACNIQGYFICELYNKIGKGGS